MTVCFRFVSQLITLLLNQFKISITKKISYLNPCVKVGYDHFDTKLESNLKTRFKKKQQQNISGVCLGLGGRWGVGGGGGGGGGGGNGDSKPRVASLIQFRDKCPFK